MADQGQLDLLRRGVAAWNRWRAENPSAIVDLNEAELRGEGLAGADLNGARLRRADLSMAWLSGADLRNAHLTEAHLVRADLERAALAQADLGHADLIRANLDDADLHAADLRHAWVHWATLRRTDLSEANLNVAALQGAYVSDADLSQATLALADLEGAALRSTTLAGADMAGARLGGTVFADADFRGVAGLESVEHRSPPTIGIDTLVRSEGQIPEVFLRGCGVPDSVIEYARSLVTDPIQYYSCFISYRHEAEDLRLAQRLHNDLQAEGVRCWFAPHDMPISGEMRQEIDQAIRLRDKLLLILSEQAISSPWVQREVEAAFEEERKRGKLVLFPIRLDDAVMASDRAWAADLRRMRNIGDFRNWESAGDAYDAMFDKVLRDLSEARI